MTQAYPQFTPVQILEAGQRAIADGRQEYATQFFQHLVDHYSQTPEAARAREVLARLNAPTAPQYVNGNNGAPRPSANTQAPLGQERGPDSVIRSRPAPPQQGGPQADNLPTDNRRTGVSGHQASGAAYAAQPHPAARQERREPAFGAPPATPDLPNTLARQAPPAAPAPLHQAGHPTAHQTAQAANPAAHAQPVAQRLYIPAPEKHYIVGRVIAGMLLLIGIIGVFAGIGLIFAAVSDPKIFAIVGANGAVAALTFAISVFIASMALLIVSQVATAVFNGADAVGDLARLERYRAGDYDDEE